MKLLLGILLLSLAARPCFPRPALNADIKNQLSLAFSLNDDSPSTPRFNLRCQPSLSLARSIGAGWKLDGEFSLDASAAAAAPGWKDPDMDGRIKPYRLWLRLSSPRFEARLGLQKINFGSAALFRPLMWFDRVDPRDPLQLTDGVYGLLLRGYIKGNATAWLWGLYGNPDPRGWDTRPTAARTPEFGGRFQAPLFTGEAGLTFHQRRLDPTAADATRRPLERRIALDGKWDLGAGVWVEAAFVHRDDPSVPLPWRRSLALGIDYTFTLGNGLYLLAEQFFAGEAAAAIGAGDGGTAFSALLARYPLGLLDSLSAVIYYDWPNRRAYNFAGWQRTYDRWQFHVLVFWNPRRGALDPSFSGSSLFSGRGFQLLAVWNI